MSTEDRRFVLRLLMECSCVGIGDEMTARLRGCIYGDGDDAGGGHRCIPAAPGQCTVGNPLLLARAAAAGSGYRGGEHHWRQRVHHRQHSAPAYIRRARRLLHALSGAQRCPWVGLLGPTALDLVILPSFHALAHKSLISERQKNSIQLHDHRDR